MSVRNVKEEATSNARSVTDKVKYGAQPVTDPAKTIVAADVPGVMAQVMLTARIVQVKEHMYVRHVEVNGH